MGLIMKMNMKLVQYGVIVKPKTITFLLIVSNLTEVRRIFTEVHHHGELLPKFGKS